MIPADFSIERLQQQTDNPAEPEKGARFEESQQEADRSYLFFFCLSDTFCLDFGCLIVFDKNHNPQSKLRLVYMFSFSPVRIKHHFIP